ncbi:response regulator transcription factor [Paenibacillus pasadenensis]|uniref:response regulator transcription factor n=1 Tax=Paenibacillus pasadenensis TaxID=217090 RepID=UPI002559A2CE|nr:response regulator transcription factor [Paenibacillus pasadenensis]
MGGDTGKTGAEPKNHPSGQKQKRAAGSRSIIDKPLEGSAVAECESVLPIRLLVVEDDPEWVRSLGLYLETEPDLLIAGWAAAPEQALAAARSLEYDAVLMDIQLGDGVQDGIATAADLLELREVPVIMLTSVEDERTMTRSFSAGAVNYVEKSRYSDLPSVIRSAVRQPAAPMQALLKEFRRLKREERLQPLTAAEREVFELIEEGRTQPEIGRRLFKSESTLKNQVNRILKKLGARSSREAVRKLRRGDTDSDRPD